MNTSILSHQKKNQMNTSKRIFVTRGNQTKILTFDSQKPLIELIKKTLDKFCILKDDYQEDTSYCFGLLAFENNYVLVEETDDLQNEDRVLLATRLELNQLNSKKEKNIIDSTENIQEMIFSKEGFEMSFDQTEDRLEKEGEAIKEHQDKSEEDNEEQGNGDLHKINLDSILEKEFESRQALSTSVTQWALGLKFSVAFYTRERQLSKENCKVSELECSNQSCPFYLQFKTKGENNSYILTQYYQWHNHPLDKKDSASSITSEILDRIKTHKDSVKNLSKLTEIINLEFKKDFKEQIIRRQVDKIKDEEFGKASMDAQVLVELLTEDSRERQYFFKSENSENGVLKNFCFMTPKMLTLANEFNDIFIIDTTHKINRFNLPLLDIILIDNLGRSITCFIAILPDSTEASFNWALAAFKSRLKVLQMSL